MLYLCCVYFCTLFEEDMRIKIVQGVEIMAQDTKARTFISRNGRHGAKYFEAAAENRHVLCLQNPISVLSMRCIAAAAGMKGDSSSTLFKVEISRLTTFQIEKRTLKVYSLSVCTFSRAQD